jgi:hypothetical protein
MTSKPKLNSKIYPLLESEPEYQLASEQISQLKKQLEKKNELIMHLSLIKAENL